MGKEALKHIVSVLYGMILNLFLRRCVSGVAGIPQINPGYEKYVTSYQANGLGLESMHDNVSRHTGATDETSSILHF